MNNRILGALLQGLGGGIKAAPDIFNETAGLNWDAQTKALSLAEMLRQGAHQRTYQDADLALREKMYTDPNASSFQELFTNKAQRGGLNQMLGYPEPNLVGPPSPITGDQERAREMYAYSLQGHQGGSYGGRGGAGGMRTIDRTNAVKLATAEMERHKNDALISVAGILPNGEGGYGITTKNMGDVAAILENVASEDDFLQRMGNIYGAEYTTRNRERLVNGYRKYRAAQDQAWFYQTIADYTNLIGEGQFPESGDVFSPQNIGQTFLEPGPSGGAYTTPAQTPNPFGQILQGMQGSGGGESSGFNFSLNQPMTFAGGGGMLQPTTQPTVQQPPRSPGVVPTEKPAPTQKPTGVSQEILRLEKAAIAEVKADLQQAQIGDPQAYWDYIAKQYPGIRIENVKKATGQK